MATALCVHGIGVACPVGLTAAATWLAIQGGCSRKRATVYFDDDGQPIIGSWLKDLDPTPPATERWAWLLGLSLRDLATTCAMARADDVPMLCVAPAQDSKARSSAIVSGEWAEALQRTRPPSVDWLKADAATGLLALAQARTLLRNKAAKAVIVCAADSLLTPRRLLELSEAGRLYTDRTPDGVIPGEAAVCLLVTDRPTNALGSIVGIGVGQEPARIDNDVPLRGDGLVAASRAALQEAGLSMAMLEARVSDAAGEAYSFKEQAIGLARQLRENMDDFPLLLPARVLGDTGCSAGLCGVSLLLPQRVPDGIDVPRRGIVYAGAAAGTRAAVVVERPR